ncbi:MAG: OmpW family protein [Burkholderiales bacterium]|nr:OmpW family protein [Burkholderiales bacterium]
MKIKLQTLAVALTATFVVGAASAEDNVFKLGVSEYTTHSKTTGITGIGVPPGADAETSNVTTVIFVYERMVNPNVGVELVLGIPPKIKAKATGSVAYLGDDVLSARNVTPTLFVNYHFGQTGDTLRPYVGGGINYTKFTHVQSRLAADAQMSDSTGWALQAGADYSLNKDWGLFASVAALKVKSKVVASGATVLQTTIDFRPVVYSFGASYKF